jgi:putative selenate reductase
MVPLGFETLLLWLVEEKRRKGTAFGVPFYMPEGHGAAVTYHGRELELPLGPAAGPHTQLAANIVCAYLSGARYFELKTVQVIDGESLQISKPCISAKREGYNVEWSTELTVTQAFEEYAKAWFLLSLISKEYYGKDGGFVFNMSVGYDLEGIRSSKLDAFIESMKDASDTPIWREMKKTALRHLGLFEHIDAEYIERINPHICDGVTLSTMHGCPAGEIGRIAEHLMREKKLHTAVKCNPTLLGLDFVRQALEKTGFGYLELDPAVFEKDLTFEDAVVMLNGLNETANACGVGFSVKLTNTLPVKNTGTALAGEAVYVSGSALYPLSVNVAARLAGALGGAVRLSYSGGADETNIALLAEAGLWPITVSTRLLKPGGDMSLRKLAAKLDGAAFTAADADKLAALAEKALASKQPEGSPAARRASAPAPFDTARMTCYICNNCVDVCPNRANVGINRDGKRYAVRLDALCNECGNCADFCPRGYTPYRDKLTLYTSRKAMQQSDNPGALIHNGHIEWDATYDDSTRFDEINALLRTLEGDAPYILRT